MTAPLKQLTEAAGCRSILCLNGELPDAGFFAATKLPLVAADGAANILYDAGLMPDMIIGDLDSVTETVRSHADVLHCPDQSSCDFEKCLVYLQEQNLLPALITGISGGYLDHILNNVSIFTRTESLFYAPPLTGFVMPPSSKSLALPPDTKISLLGLPEAMVSTGGLKWELKNTRLSFGGKNSCFNRTQCGRVHIAVTEGRLLVLIYLTEISDAASEKNS